MAINSRISAFLDDDNTGIAIDGHGTTIEDPGCPIDVEDGGNSQLSSEDRCM